MIYVTWSPALCSNTPKYRTLVRFTDTYIFIIIIIILLYLVAFVYEPFNLVTRIMLIIEMRIKSAP
jgi:predicted ferric reductase